MPCGNCLFCSKVTLLRESTLSFSKFSFVIFHADKTVVVTAVIIDILLEEYYVAHYLM